MPSSPKSVNIANPIVLVLLAGLVLGIASCTDSKPAASPGDGSSGAASPVSPTAAVYGEHTAFAVYAPSAVPRWFELGPRGPVVLSGPQDASLSDYVPWPLARRVAGMVAGNGMLTLGVNGDGFIALRPAPGGTVSLFRIAGHQALVDYSMGSVFSYQGSPAVLLYRDSFFVDPVLPALEKRAFALSSEQGRVQGLDLAALAMPDAREGWDVDALFHGQDGFWYYRAVRSSGEQTGRAYYRTQDLSSSGEPITAGAFRNAQSPQPAGQAGDLLGRALKSCAAELIPGQSAVVAVLAQTAASPRTYWLGQDPGSASMESGGSAGVLQLWAYEDSESALAIFPDGRGYRVVAGMNPAPSSFRLPGLPKNFVYTGIALLGSRIVASWEEQDSWAVGAAGFVLVP